MKEIWKDIEGYENLYKISNFGNIISKRYWLLNKYIYKERKIKPTIANNGYIRVSLTKDKKVKYVNIHRLVAQAFIPNPDNLPCVNHIDGNKENNRVDNLEWCTHSYNNKEAYRIGLRKAYRGKDNCRSRAILQYDLSGNFIKEWDSLSQITKKLGYDYTCVLRCCKGKYKKSYGCIWKYKEDKNVD